MTELETAMAENRAAIEEFVVAARAVDAAAWGTPRGPQRWSPAQVAEHLAIVYEYNRKVIRGDAGRGAPRLLRPFLRWMVVDRTLKAGRFTRKGRAPRIFQPSAAPAAAATVLARLTAAVAGLEADIRSGHPAARHTVDHPFFGRLDTVGWMRLQAIHARHHRSQLT